MSIEAKAIRLVAQHRVYITYDSDDVMTGLVQGDSGVYVTSTDPAGWRCECPSTRRCSHVLALELAVAARREGVLDDREEA